MLDNSAILLVNTWQVSRNIHESNKGNVEGVTGADKSGTFHGGVYIQASRQEFGLIGDNSYRYAIQAPKADDHILRIMAVDLQELVIISHGSNDFLHVVRQLGIGGHHGIQ